MTATMEQPSMTATMEQPSAFKKFKSSFNRWSVRIGATILIILVVVAHLHIIGGIDFIIPLSALIFLLSEQVNDLTEQSDSSVRKFEIRIGSIERETRDQGYAIKALADILRPSLLGLTDCVLDLSDALKSIPSGVPVLIEHFALDMTAAWTYFFPLLESHPNLSNVEYRLLILTDDLSRLENADEEVKAWARNVPRSLRTIRADITAIFGKPRQQYRKIRFEVRKYASTPIVHGFRVVTPDLRCYIAICRWGGPDYNKYEWGEPKYQRLEGGSSSEAVKDMLNIFDGYFNHHWVMGDPAFTFEHPKLQHRDAPRS
jgi:hypothetical protein